MSMINYQDSIPALRQRFEPPRRDLQARFVRAEEISRAAPNDALWMADHHAAKVRSGVLRELQNNFGFGSRPPMPGVNRLAQCGFARHLPTLFRERLEAVFTALEVHGFDSTASARAAFNTITGGFIDALDRGDADTAGAYSGDRDRQFRPQRDR